MPRGQPDYGMYASKEVTGSVSDLGELASRLGSIVTYDRRGDVTWFDGFEGDLMKWKTEGEGEGASIDVSSVRARNGSFSCLLTCGKDGDKSAYIAHYMPTPVLSGIGLEFSWASGVPFDNIEMIIQVRDPTHLWYGEIILDRTNKKLTYYDKNGAWQDLATGLVFYNQDYLFNTMKLVIDLVENTYVRLIYNQVTYNMSAKNLRVVTGIYSALYRYDEIYAQGRYGYNDEVHIDDAILTQNEP